MRRPNFIAKHARNAQGLLGRVIAFIMAHETWSQNLRVMDALRIGRSDHIIDVGCGHGRSLSELATRASMGHVVGADPSDLMVEIASQRNRPLIDAARVKVVLATVESLPFADESFDKVLCVHVLYFWKDLDASLREVARVLKPGGRSGLLFRTKADPAAIASFPAEIYRFPELAEVTEALEQAGLDVHAASDRSNEPVLLIAEKRRAQTAEGPQSTDQAETIAVRRAIT
ncbi:class I SAM-dependent methyltransferase [Bradyrhizobium cajani]|nr:class I SAM-dependent methyltransferase [Bradyrhizobium cajani]MCP3373598.1 class I SAM-dependent methyltransferase [Bradyrhizobium cajani]